MNDDVIDQLLAKVPSEIRNAMEPMNSDLCWAAFILLLDHDDGLKISEIERQLGTPRFETLHIMKRLNAAGLTRLVALRFEDIGDREASIYQATRMGRSLVRALFQGVLPQPLGVDVEIHVK
jgi:hypothetical protein